MNDHRTRNDNGLEAGDMAARQARRPLGDIVILTSAVTVIGGTLMIGGQPVVAADFEVTTLDDATNPSDGLMSLREALAAADGLAGADTVTFAPGLAGTISLDSPLRIGETVALVGPGESVVTLTNPTGGALYVYRDASPTISGLTIDGAAGHGIRLDVGAGTDSLTLNDVTITGSRGRGISGSMEGTLSVTDSTISNNGSDGIGLDGVGYDVIITASSISGNNGHGVTLQNVYRDIDLTGSTLDGNAYNALDATYVDGAVDVSTSAFDGNSMGARLSNVGGTIDFDLIEITGSRQFQAVLLEETASTVTVTDSTISDTLYGSAFRVQTGVTSVALDGVTTFDNAYTAFYVAGAGSGSGTTISVLNSTLSQLERANGVGLFNTGSADVTVSHSTLIGDEPATPLSCPFLPGSVVVDHSIIVDAVSLYPRCSGPVTITNSIVPVGAAAGASNIETDDPMLGPLQDNGGPTLTRRPNPGSPALDAGDNASVTPPVADQRGVARIAGPEIDIGAVEADAGVLAISPLTVSVAEADGTATLTVIRSGTGDGAASVEIDTVDGTAIGGDDFTVIGSTLTWADGDTGSRQVDVELTSDAETEPDETFEVTLSNAVGPTISDPTATVTITDSTTPTTTTSTVPAATSTTTTAAPPTTSPTTTTTTTPPGQANRAPVITPIPARELIAGMTSEIVVVVADPDDDAVTLTARSDDSSVFAVIGVASRSGQNALTTNEFVVTVEAPPDAAGSARLVVEASDGQATTTAEATMTARSVVLPATGQRSLRTGLVVASLLIAAGSFVVRISRRRC